MRNHNGATPGLIGTGHGARPNGFETVGLAWMAVCAVSFFLYATLCAFVSFRDASKSKISPAGATGGPGKIASSPPSRRHLCVSFFIDRLESLYLNSAVILAPLPRPLRLDKINGSKTFPFFFGSSLQNTTANPPRLSDKNDLRDPPRLFQ